MEHHHKLRGQGNPEAYVVEAVARTTGVTIGHAAGPRTVAVPTAAAYHAA